MNPQRPRATRREKTRIARARRADYRATKARCAPAGKTRFATFDIAVAAALRLSSTLGRPIRTYPCPDCGGWHLTRRRTPPKDQT
jgi:hypothetical protein